MAGLNSVKETTHDIPLFEMGQNTVLNTDKKVGKIAADTAVKKASMNHIPDFVRIHRKDSKAILKGVMMTLGLPLLLPYLACHALGAAFTNTINEKKIGAKNTSRDRLIDKKQDFEKKLGELKLSQAQNKQNLISLQNTIARRKQVLAEATGDDWGMDITEPTDIRRTEPKNPKNITASDLKTDYDKYLYAQETKDVYEAGMEKQRDFIGTIHAKIRNLGNELSVVNHELKVLYDELEIPKESPFQALEARMQKINELPPEEQKKQLLKGLEAGKELIRYLESNGRIDSNRAEAYLELNANYADLVKNETQLNLVKNYLNGLLTL